VKNSKSILVGVTVALIAAGAGVLASFRAHQKLGQPGVKVVQQPIFDPDGKVARTNSVYLPERVLDYSSDSLPVTPVELGWLPEDTTYGRRRYKTPDGFEVSVSVVLMGTDRTSIHQPQYCLTGQGLRIDQSEATTIPIERPHPYDLPVNKLTATGTRQTAGGEKVIVRAIYVYWFVSDNELTADHLQRMWWMARDLIRTGTLQRWAYVGCLVVCAPGQEEKAFERVRQFIGASVPEFQLTAGFQVAKGPQASVSQRQ
jgi:hypothetical protein